MSIKMVLFDLDGTLLPMDQEKFTERYFKLLTKKLAPLGYNPKELIGGVWKGTGAMVKNDGSRINEEAFWETFCKAVNRDAKKDKPVFDDFYRNDFQMAKDVCGYNPLAAEAVRHIKSAGLRTALATNPIFPDIATKSRIKWAGLDPDDFEFCTTYENASFCKPNPEYFAEIARRLNVEPQDCLMVGNDMSEDTPAALIGMKVFILTDCIINKANEDVEKYPHGGFEELIEYINQSCKAGG